MHDEDPEPDPRVVDALLSMFFALAFNSGATCTERALAFYTAHQLSMCHLKLHPWTDNERYMRLEREQKEKIAQREAEVAAELQAGRS